jgi:hypothetical protein
LETWSAKNDRKQAKHATRDDSPNHPKFEGKQRKDWLGSPLPAKLYIFHKSRGPQQQPELNSQQPTQRQKSGVPSIEANGKVTTSNSNKKMHTPSGLSQAVPMEVSTDFCTPTNRSRVAGAKCEIARRTAQRARQVAQALADEPVQATLSPIVKTILLMGALIMANSAMPRRSARNTVSSFAPEPTAATDSSSAPELTEPVESPNMELLISAMMYANAPKSWYNVNSLFADMVDKGAMTNTQRLAAVKNPV